MKIGILTHPLDYNYGCLLQAFALQSTLRNMGYEVITINRFSDPYRPFSARMKEWIYRVYARLIKGRNVPIVWNPRLSFKKIDILCSNTKCFVDRNIKHTARVLPKELADVDAQYKFDAYVVGSDQVWLPHFCPTSFLDFVHREGVKKIFYAASSGKQSFADYPDKVLQCKLLSADFIGISVREESLVDVVKNSLGRDAIHVLDPTFLLEPKDYIESCIEEVADTPMIFTYILDKTRDKSIIIEKVKEDLGLPIISGTVDNDFAKGKGMSIKHHVYPSVDNWILGLKRAEFVVTDSFHGMCMSIIFRKPFVVIGNASRGIDRFNSALKIFGLQSRLILSSDKFSSAFYSPLNDKTITDVISTERKKAIDFLTSNLA